MDIDSLDDDALDRLADRVADRLPPGSYGDRVVLTRRQLVGAATGTLGVGALVSLGVDPAVAQAAGQVGTDSEPVDVVASNVDANSLSTTDFERTNAGVTAFLSSNQAIPDSTQTVVALDSVTSDDEGELNTSTNAVEVASDGDYLISAAIFFDGASIWSTGDEIFLRVVKNSNNNIHNLAARKVGGGNQSFVAPMKHFELNSGDSLTLEVKHFTGGDVILESGAGKTFFSVTQVG